MKSKIYLFIQIICIPIAGCTLSVNQNNDQMKDGNTAVHQQEVAETLVQMWDAIEKGDIERYAKYIHPDFTQFGETDSVLRVGKDAELVGIKSWMEQAEDVHTEMVEPQITVRGNTAWIVYYWQDSGLQDGKLFETRGKSTRIFVKENGSWLCIHGHYTLLPVENR